MKKIYITENKVWTIQVNGQSFTTSYGNRYGADLNKLRRNTKTFDSEEKCEKEKEKIIKSKCEGGYEELSVSIKGVPLKELVQVHNVKKGNSKVLTILNEDKIPLQFIKEILSLSHLEELETSIPVLIEQIGRFIGLKKLTIHKGHAISRLPETVTNLKNLEYLCLKKYSKDMTLPDSIFKILSLKKLDLSSCQRKNIPDCIGNLVSLEELDLGYNLLEDLPQSLENLQKLTHLNICNNEFQSIPESVYKLHNLVDLDISFNRSQKIDAKFLQLTALKKFRIFFTNITNIPENSLAAGSVGIKDFLKNGSLSKLSIEIAPIPENSELLIRERKEQMKGAIHDIRKELYGEFSHKIFAQILAFIFGETNELPQVNRSETERFGYIVELFNPILKWNFIDRRLLAFICNDTFLYPAEGYSGGYYSYFFGRFFYEELMQEQKGEDFFGQLIEELKSCQVDEWTALTGYLEATTRGSLLRHDGSTNSLGKVIIKYLQKDREKIMNLLWEKHYTSSLFPLLATKRDILDELLDELFPYYANSDAQKHVYFTKLEELCKIDSKAYESLVLEQMQGSDCSVCIMECYRILLTYQGNTYKVPAAEHAKKVLVNITTHKNNDKEYKFNWYLSSKYFGDDTPGFIQWLCDHLGEEVKHELFTYVKDTNALSLDIVNSIVKRFGQDALATAIETLKMSKKDNSAIAHYRQAFTILKDLDYTAYYDDVWEIACSTYPDLADLACMSLASRPIKDVYSKAVSFLSSKNKAERRAGVAILSLLRTPEAISELKPIIENEIKDDIRNLAIQPYYAEQKEETIASMKERIANAGKKGKLKKPVTKWIDSLPMLAWHDGKQLTKEEQYYLFYRQSSSKSITPDIEAAPMYALLDKTKGAEVAFETFQYINKNIGFKAASKLAFALIGTLGDERLIELLKDMAIKGKNANVCDILAMFETFNAAFALDQIIQHFEIKYPNIRRSAEEAFENTALRMGLTYFELKDQMLPDFDFVNKERKLDVGNGYTLSISPKLKLAYTNNKGKQVKSIPKPPPSIKHMLKEINANLKDAVKQYTQSVEYYLVTQRQWPGNDWKQHFIEHPVAFAFSQSLIWQQNESKTFMVMPDGNLQDETGSTLNIKNSDYIQLVHPLNLDDSIKNNWKAYLKDENIQPAILQLDRKLITPTTDELEIVRSRAFEDNSLDSATFKYRAHKRGWKRGNIADGGGIASYTKAFKEAGIDVFINTEGIAVQADFDGDNVTLGKCYFTPFGSVQLNGDLWNSEPSNESDERLIPIKEVPLLVFSEAMKDLKEITKTK